MDPHEGDPGFKDRKSDRRIIEERAAVRAPGLATFAVTVRNVSPGGFMAECPEMVRIGSHISLDVPGIGPVHAQVRWQLGSRMGGMFLDPISMQRCAWTAVRAAAA